MEQEFDSEAPFHSHRANFKIERNEFADEKMDETSNEIKKVSALSTLADEKMYDVEQIVNMRKKQGQWQYKIRWKGYTKRDDTWEPESNLSQCLDMIADFKQKKEEQLRKRQQNKRAASKECNRAESSSISDDTSIENGSDSLPITDSKESQPDTFWKDLSAGRISIPKTDMYSSVKGRRAKKTQDAQESKTPSSHSSTSNDSTDRPNTTQDETDFNLGVLQTLSHFFDNSLQSIDRLRKQPKDHLYRSRSKLSKGINLTKKTSIMRVERVSCSPGKLMLKIKGHKVASSSYSKTIPKKLERLAHHNLRSKKLSPSIIKSKVPVQNEAISVVNVNPLVKKCKNESDTDEPDCVIDDLFTACHDGKSAVVEKLFQKYKSEIGGNKIMLSSVVHQLYTDALAGNKWKIIEVLINNGADINTQSSDGNTLLMMACQKSNFEVVQKLLDHGAFKDKQNSSGYTALMIACSVGDEKSVCRLLNSGANFVIPNSAGLTVLNLAKQTKNSKIQDILTQHVSRIKACFETEAQTAVLGKGDIINALFPLHCSTQKEQSEIKITFQYESTLDTESSPNTKYIIFIADAIISEVEVSCKLVGRPFVTWVNLNSKKQEPVHIGGCNQIGYTCAPLQEGSNVITVFTEQSNGENVKLIICAYKVKMYQNSILLN